jgi:hypothetical protein
MNKIIKKQQGENNMNTTEKIVEFYKTFSGYYITRLGGGGFTLSSGSMTKYGDVITITPIKELISLGFDVIGISANPITKRLQLHFSEKKEVV